MKDTGFASAAPDLTVVCIQSREPLQGELYHRFSREPTVFYSEYELVDAIDRLCDEIGYPNREMNFRSFRLQHPSPRRNCREAERVMSVSELSEKSGEQGTFMVHVQFRQNATWQGQVTWVEKKQTQQFRSALELLKLIDSALDGADQKK